jgi:DNA repair protein RecN (Recombination protein N)
MLALKVVLTVSDPVPVLVFDEVDSGIGGATASAVGERLARLAKGVQILVVTHSPQVAARGNNHLCVSKQTKSKQTITDVETLDAPARREEIARMLAGSHVTDAARQAAASLLEDGVGFTPRRGKVAR